MAKKHAYPHVLSVALDQPWAITRPMLSMIAAILGRHVAGQTIDLSALDVRTPVERTVPTGVAVLPVHGVLAPRMNLFSDISGGTSFEDVARELDAALAAPDIGTIVLDIDSPGGSVAGATECARKVLAARTTKHIVAHANFQMCSAAYWIAAGASEIVAAPSAMLGSIGVFSIHEDLSKALEDLGVKLTYISAGKYKVDGHEAAPLSDSARARFTAIVEASYTRFVEDVAHGRGITPAAVRAGYGEGSVVTADEALSLGMVDAIATLEDTITRVQRTPPRVPGRATPGVPPVRDDTPQEPSPATGQDRRTAQRELERALLTLGL